MSAPVTHGTMTRRRGFIDFEQCPSWQSSSPPPLHSRSTMVQVTRFTLSVYLIERTFADQLQFPPVIIPSDNPAFQYSSLSDGDRAFCTQAARNCNNSWSASQLARSFWDSQSFRWVQERNGATEVFGDADHCTLGPSASVTVAFTGTGGPPLQDEFIMGLPVVKGRLAWQLEASVQIYSLVPSL